VYNSWIGVVLADLNVEWRVGDVDTVELDVDNVDAVFAWEEADRILIVVNVLNEAIILSVRWCNDLEQLISE
jgi:hypothetical protein